MPQTTTPPKLYTIRDIPRPADMSSYLARVQEIRNIFPALPGTPQLPEDMNHLTYGAANDVETVLLKAESAVNSMVNSWIYSGELESGGI